MKTHHELKSLSGLISLDVHIHSIQLMPAELFSEKLNRYKILIGEKIEDLYLDEMQGIKNLLYELDGTGFPQLKNLYIQNGSELQFIFDSMEVASCKAFSILESLVHLEKICQGKLEEECSKRLKITSVECCN
ncbi:hypothetical protein GOBAR_DD33390 [Gossypium barbadense]|nr:hypothetical protein GOBAR_DD33390 [Gossypium barbadense]